MLDEFLGAREGKKGVILYSWRRGLILFPRSERAESDPRSIDTLRAPFPAVLMLEPCDFAVKNADASGAQKQTFTSREKY